MFEELQQLKNNLRDGRPQLFSKKLLDFLEQNMSCEDLSTILRIGLLSKVEIQRIIHLIQRLQNPFFDVILDKFLENNHIKDATSHCGGHGTRMLMLNKECLSCGNFLAFPARQRFGENLPPLCPNCDESSWIELFGTQRTCEYGNSSCVCSRNPPVQETICFTVKGDEILKTVKRKQIRKIFRRSVGEVTFVSGCFEGCFGQTSPVVVKRRTWADIAKTNP